MNNKITINKLNYLGFAGILFFFILSFRFYTTGDDIALITGLRFAVDCIKNNPAMIPCGDEVLPFPVFQYLIGAPFVLMNFDNSSIVKVFIVLNSLMSFLSGYLFFSLGKKRAGEAGGIFSLLLILSGYMMWYVMASFNEATSFALISLFIYGILFRFNIILLSFIAFLCCITKEVLFPYLLLMSYLAYSIRDENRGNSIIKNLLRFFKAYKITLICLFLGVTFNLAFNYFRFGSIRNLGYLNPIYSNPIEYVPIFFVDILFSPAAGLFFVWLSAFSMIAYYLVFYIIKFKNNLCILISIICFLAINIGLATWFSPFGAVAWGPRLTLPFIGGLLILVLYSEINNLIRFFNGKYYILKNFILTCFFIISALPTVAFILEPLHFHQISQSIKSKVEIESGIKNFTIETAGSPLYQEALIQNLKQNIIIPTAIEVVERNFIIVSLYFFSLMLLSTSVTIRKSNLVFYISLVIMSVLMVLSIPSSYNFKNLFSLLVSR